MAKQLRLRRGNTAGHAVFIGANGEITADIEAKKLVFHDGATAGGRRTVMEDEIGTAATQPTSRFPYVSDSLAELVGRNEELKVARAAFRVVGWHEGSNIGGHQVEYDPDFEKSQHGKTGWSDTVPPVFMQPGGTLAQRRDNYLSGNGETDSGGVGGFVIVSPIDNPYIYGALRDGSDNAMPYSRFFEQAADTGWVSNYLPTKYTAWHPPVQPPARVDRDGYFTDGYGGTADEYINDLWEPLRAYAPDYITRASLGKDQSGTYDVWRYIFEPPAYDRTIIINGCIHGSEITGMLATYLMFKQMVYEWTKEPQLAHLRWRTRIVIIPISNPWGTSQTPQKNRMNVNNVNLNRNFDYRWDEYVGSDNTGTNYKGTAPFSEAETQYIRDTLIEFQGDSTCWIDMHNFGTGGEVYPIFLGAEYEDGSDIVNEVIANFRKDGEDVGFGRTYNPTGYHYAQEQFGIYGVSPEFGDDIHGDSGYSSISMTKAVEWFGNVILAFSYAKSKGRRVKYLSPFCTLATWSKSGTAITVSDTNYAEEQSFRVNLDIQQPGYVKITGYIVATSDTPDSLLFVTPRFGQSGYGKWGPADNINYTGAGNPREAEFGSYTSFTAANVDRRQVNIVAALPVYPTGGNNGPLNVGLLMRVSAGTAEIFRYRMMVEFIPSAAGDQRMKLYSSVGREADALNAQQVQYPKN